MSKTAEQARAIVRQAIQGGDQKILVVVPHADALAMISVEVERHSTLIGLRYETAEDGRVISYAHGGTITFRALDDEPEDIRTFRTHEEAAMAVLATALEHRGLMMVAVAPTQQIARMVFETLAEEARRAGECKVYSTTLQVVWPNGASVTFNTAERPERLEGHRYNAAWTIAPHLWKGRQIWTALLACTRQGTLRGCSVESIG